MVNPMWIRKARALVTPILVAGAVVLLMLAAMPEPVSVARLGAEWQCSRTAFVLTTSHHAEPARIGRDTMTTISR